MKTKNLLIIGPTLGTYGGLESFMIALAKTASEWPEYKIRLCFKMVTRMLVNEGLKEMAKSDAYEVFYINRGSAELARLILWADILHVQNTPPDVIFPAKLFRKKIFLTIHNWRRKAFDIHNFSWGIAAKMAYRRWYNSKFVWDTWEPTIKSPGSDCIPTVSILPRLKYIPQKRKGFLFIGRWIANKGIEEILQAYAICNPDIEKWPLTIIGDGPLRPEIMILLNQLDLKDVCLPGFVNADEKEEMIARAKWLLAPAKTKEDLGLTPIEARNAGVPSIVTKDGGLPEAGGEAALIAEPGSISDLARCMKVAIAMNDEEYSERAELAFDSLTGFLKPMEFYRNAYAS